MFVNYNDCILNIVAAIRNYLGLPSSYSANAYFAKELAIKKPERIILALIDGMGSRLIDRKLADDGFFKQYQLFEISTVFPSTTTAATAAVENGRSPNENGWVGWNQYFKEVDDFVVPFLGEGYYSKHDYGYDFVRNILPVTTTADELMAKGIQAKKIEGSFSPIGAKDIEEFVDMIIKDSYSDNRYIYAYWDKYDSLMHKIGVDNEESDAYLRQIEAVFARRINELNEGTMLVIVADHGLVDIKEEINVYETPLNDFLIRPTAVEPRATAFYVKEACKADFASYFKSHYEDDFILLTKEQVLNSHLFGDHKNHERLGDFIGDFMAIAKGHKHFVYHEQPSSFKFLGAHAGCHIDELMIPVITYTK